MNEFGIILLVPTPLHFTRAGGDKKNMTNNKKPLMRKFIYAKEIYYNNISEYLSFKN